MRKKIKSERNKTIDFSLEEGQKYLDMCLRGDASDAPFATGEANDTIILGDCFDVLKRLPKESVDLLIVDPPYNMDKDFSGRKFKKTSPEEYERFTVRWIEAVFPALKAGCSVYVCCDWKTSPLIGTILGRYFNIRNRITWEREKGRGTENNWKNSMEDIWYAVLGDGYKFHADAVKVRRQVLAPYKKDGEPKDWEETSRGNFRNTYASNFWDDISVPYWSMPENTAHPTQKPEKLLAKLILASSDPGDLVLDPFAGSGSTAVAAKKLGRRYIGIEINPQYCAWAEKRLETADTDKTIQGYTDGVFWEAAHF